MLDVKVTTVSSTELNDYGWKVAHDDPTTTVRFIRGCKMLTLEAAYDEIAAALQFPWYFGENHAAMIDCLGDLAWLTDNVMVIAYDARKLLVEEELEKISFYEAIREGARAFCDAKNPMHPDRLGKGRFTFVLQCASDEISFIIKEFENLGESCSTLDLAATRH